MDIPQDEQDSPSAGPRTNQGLSGSSCPPPRKWYSLLPETAVGRIAFVVIVLVLLAARLHNLGTHSPHIDEAFAVGVADQSYGDILHTLRTRDPHPPLYYLALHTWILAGRATGVIPGVPLGDVFHWTSRTEEVTPLLPHAPRTRVVSESVDPKAVFFVRIPGVLLSVLTCLLLFGFGREFYSETAALCASAVFAVSRLETFWAQSVRYHTLLMLLSLVATWLLVRIQERSPGPSLSGLSPGGMSADRCVRRWQAGYVGVSILGLYTNYFFGLTLIMHGLYLLISRSLRRQWFVCWGVIALAFAPWLPIFFEQLRIVSHAEYKTAGISIASVPLALYRLIFSYGLEMNTPVEGLGYWVGLLMLVLVFYFSVRANRMLVVLYAFVPLVVLFVVSLRKPLFDTHYFLIGFPGYCLFLGRGVEAILGRFRRDETADERR